MAVASPENPPNGVPLVLLPWPVLRQLFPLLATRDLWATSKTCMRLENVIGGLSMRLLAGRRVSRLFCEPSDGSHLFSLRDENGDVAPRGEEGGTR